MMPVQVSIWGSGHSASPSKGGRLRSGGVPAYLGPQHALGQEQPEVTQLGGPGGAALHKCTLGASRVSVCTCACAYLLSCSPSLSRCELELLICPSICFLCVGRPEGAPCAGQGWVSACLAFTVASAGHTTRNWGSGSPVGTGPQAGVEADLWPLCHRQPPCWFWLSIETRWRQHFLALGSEF